MDKEVAKEKGMTPPVGNCCGGGGQGGVQGEGYDPPSWQLLSLLMRLGACDVSADSSSCVAVSLRTGAARQLSSSSRAERTKLC